MNVFRQIGLYTNISGQLSKDLISMKAKLASLQVLLPFYDVSSDKLEKGIVLNAANAMLGQFTLSRKLIDLRLRCLNDYLDASIFMLTFNFAINLY